MNPCLLYSPVAVFCFLFIHIVRGWIITGFIRWKKQTSEREREQGGLRLLTLEYAASRHVSSVNPNTRRKEGNIHQIENRSRQGVEEAI